jgi:hypothetical protein
VADEICFVVGPATVTLLATQVHPAAGIAAAAVACLAGTLWFASQRETEPPVSVREKSHYPERERQSPLGKRALLPAPGLAVLRLRL